MRSTTRILVKLAAGTLGLVVLVVAGTYLWLRTSLPELDGTATLAGLSARVDVVRDRFAIPHVHASTEPDAWRALGYLHAQDRLWQLETSRRIAAGTMAELFGAKALDTDKFIRALGVRKIAETIASRLDSASRAALEAYAEGVNGYIDSHRGAWPAEFEIVRAAPGHWAPADSIAWMLMMAWDLAGNWQQELLRLRLSQRLSRLQLAQFLPPYPGDRALPLPDLKALYGDSAAPGATAAAAWPFDDHEGVGSNNWVVAGSRSQSGKPLLANDPHLGLTVPSTWYLAHVDTPGLHAIGATLPGIPAIVLGHNRRIAWGFTNTNPDVQDLFVERIDPKDSGRYISTTGSEAFIVTEERFRVKGAPDEVVKLRRTRHGPIISDVYAGAREAAPKGCVIAMAWAALDESDRSFVALAALARAGNWTEFVDALRELGAPQQNIVYADVDGNIGFVAPGRVPVRSPDNDLHGLAPAPGWDVRYDWTGTIPFDELPKSYNPASGYVVTANQKIVDANYARFITSEWAPPYRADRIRALVESVPRHTVASFRAIQADTVSLAARAILPFVVAADVSTDAAKQAVERLRRWDGEMRADAVEPQIFHAWLREFTRLAYGDELGPLFDAAWDERAVFIENVLRDRAGSARWCDDVGTPETESCASLIGRAMERAVAGLTEARGSDPSGWTWGTVHRHRFAHRPFGTVPVLDRVFDLAVAGAGDTYTVNVGRHRIGDKAPYESRHAAGFRAIYDLADLDRSRYVQTTGQSGNRLSPHYADFLPTWSRVEDLPMSMDASAEANALGRLVLLPGAR